MEATYKAKWMAAHSTGEPAWFAFAKRIKPGTFLKAGEICAEEHAKRGILPDQFIEALGEGNKKFKIIPTQFLASNFAAQFIANWIPPSERTRAEDLDEAGHIIPIRKLQWDDLLPVAEWEWNAYQAEGPDQEYFPEPLLGVEGPPPKAMWPTLRLSETEGQTKWDKYMVAVKQVLVKCGSSLLKTAA